MYKKDKVFVDIYNNFSDDNKPPVLSEAPPPTTQFVEKTEDIDRSTLYSFDGPFQLLQADVAYTSFLATSAGDPKFVFSLLIYLRLKLTLIQSKIKIY